jgi:hypothetical protein
MPSQVQQDQALAIVSIKLSVRRACALDEIKISLL